MSLLLKPPFTVNLTPRYVLSNCRKCMHTLVDIYHVVWHYSQHNVPFLGATGHRGANFCEQSGRSINIDTIGILGDEDALCVCFREGEVFRKQFCTTFGWCFQCIWNRIGQIDFYNTHVRYHLIFRLFSPILGRLIENCCERAVVTSILMSMFEGGCRVCMSNCLWPEMIIITYLSEFIT